MITFPVKFAVLVQQSVCYISLVSFWLARLKDHNKQFVFMLIKYVRVHMVSVYIYNFSYNIHIIDPVSSISRALINVKLPKAAL